MIVQLLLVLLVLEIMEHTVIIVVDGLMFLTQLFLLVLFLVQKVSWISKVFTISQVTLVQVV